jgi:hypothetical protein
MEPITAIIVGVVILVLLIVIARFLKSCLPKVIVGLIVLAALGYLIYWFITR